MKPPMNLVLSVIPDIAEGLSFHVAAMAPFNALFQLIYRQTGGRSLVRGKTFFVASISKMKLENKVEEPSANCS